MKNVLAFFFCSFFLVGALQSTPEQPICLNMIVKNESAVITRCLASVKPFIDYWVIVDTGSDDNTQEIIKEFLKDIPGEVHERPWKNFSFNRNEALALAQGKGEYILFMDADDYLTYEPGYQLPHLTHDMYTLWRTAPGYSLLNHQFVRANLPWKWIGAVHEYLDCGTSYSMATITEIVHHLGNDGASHSDPKKFLKYITLLEEEVAKDPNNMRDAISLAKSYSGAKQNEKAIALYERVVQQCDRKEDILWALIEIGNLKRDLQRPIEEAITAYYQAHRLLPLRAEPVYLLAELYNQLREYDLAYSCLQSWQHLPFHNQRGIVFNMDWIQEYGLLFELSTCAFYTSHYEEALNACDEILQKKNLPDEIARLTERNRHTIVNTIIRLNS